MVSAMLNSCPRTRLLVSLVVVAVAAAVVVLMLTPGLPPLLRASALYMFRTLSNMC